MHRASVDAVELVYANLGTGEPMVCIHGAFIAATFTPLLAEPSLAGRSRRICYHRRAPLRLPGGTRGEDPYRIQ